MHLKTNKILFLTVLLIAFSPVLKAADRIVTIASDVSGSTCGASCSLRQAVTAASANDTIKFDSALDTHDICLNSTLTISKTLTFQGNGLTNTIINASCSVASTYSAFTINSSASGSVITGVKIIGGHTSANGGGINLRGGILTVSLSEISGNTAAQGGGLAATGGSTLNLSQVTISGNQSSQSGSGLYTLGTSGTSTLLDMTQVIVSDNTTTDGAASGGGISADNGSSIQIKQSLLSSNDAGSVSGGGLYVTGSTSLPSTVLIINSTFYGNEAANGGAAYIANKSTVSVSSSTFSGNAALGSSNNSGGAFYLSGISGQVATVSVKSSLVNGNTASVLARNDCFLSNTNTSFTSLGNNLLLTTSCTDSSSNGYVNLSSDIITSAGLSLSSLADNGGFTQTMAIPVTSSAHNAGSCTLIGGATNTLDQRGKTRSSTCDIGAYEYLATWYFDGDGDSHAGSTTTLEADSQPLGYLATADDCDDTNALINPSATEICDGVDNNCNGLIDDNAQGGTTYYLDTDGDGYGVVTGTVLCSQQTSYVSVSGDCNDSNAVVNPNATEICDGVDNDCSGAIDDNAQGVITYYLDADGDTFGDATHSQTVCNQPSGYVTNAADCNDSSATINPSSNEVCDLLDNDCDGQIDNNASDRATWYADADGDTFGDSNVSTIACNQPSGYVADHTDCNDNSSTINPTTTWYADSDGDTFGDSNVSTTACNQPGGYVADHTDCNDTLAGVNPLATETCATNYDDNCNGQINESGSAGETLFYRDNDNDGYGDTFTFVSACVAPTHYIVDNTDCDDTSALYHPNATEICDNHDNNCDGTVDEATATDATTWYTDADSDGYGDSTSSNIACNQPVGTVAISGDCNDARADVNPAAHESCTATEDLNCDGSVGDADADGDGYRACEDCNDANAAINIAATETCDGVDNNCDGTVDETTSADAAIWYADADGDAFGNALVTTPACSKPTGFVADNTDCDDTSGAVKPGAVESCDGIDNNCDGDVDPSTSIDAAVFYQDSDSDGHGSEIISTNACSQPNGYVVNHDDCNDVSAAFNPSVADICGDHTDNNCDGVINPFDNDADGYSSCEGDCDDTNAAVHPTATELCDSIDNNCDGTVDEATSADASTWYADTDSDTFGDTNSSVHACNQPSGYVADNTDCDDTNGAVHPNAAEVCANGINDDCDSATPDGTAITWYQDTDGDTFGNPLVTQTSCGTPAGYVADNTDCDDTRIDVYPHAIENCNERDDDCDGQIDEDIISTFYQDSDGDGLGNPDASAQACLVPEGYTTNKNDCDDTLAKFGAECPTDTKETNNPETGDGSVGDNSDGDVNVGKGSGVGSSSGCSLRR